MARSRPQNGSSFTCSNRPQRASRKQSDLGSTTRDKLSLFLYGCVVRP